MKHLYLKSAVWDFVLVCAASCALGYALLGCFYIDPALQYSFVPAALIAVVLLGLFAASQSKRVLRIAGPLVGVALVALWVASAALTPGGAFLVDSEQNYLIFTMSLSLCAVACYLLSRSRVGCALLFIGGVFFMSLVQFLYERGELWSALLFVVAALALVVFKNYQTSLKAATSVRKVAFAPGFVVALAASAIAVGLGAAAWFGVIAPLDPPAAEVKLITEYRALETLRVKGVADVYQVPNLDMTSDQTNDDERTTDDIKESENGRRYPANGEAEEEDQDNGSDSQQVGLSFLGINIDNPDDVFDFISYLQKALPWVLLVIALAIAGFFVGRRMLRRRRLNRVMQLAPSQQVAELYPLLMKKLERIGIRKAPGQTLGEYARANASTMEVFDNAAAVPFTQITDDYVAVAYGKAELGSDASDRIGAYYDAFWKAARKKLGNVKYFFRSFRL